MVGTCPRPQSGEWQSFGPSLQSDSRIQTFNHYAILLHILYQSLKVCEELLSFNNLNILAELCDLGCHSTPQDNVVQNLTLPRSGLDFVIGFQEVIPVGVISFRVEAGHARKSNDTIQGRGWRRTTWATNHSCLYNGAPIETLNTKVGVNFPGWQFSMTYPDSVKREQRRLCIWNPLGSVLGASSSDCCI